MKTSESRTLEYRKAIVDSDFLSQIIDLLNTSGLTDIQIAISTENKSYESDDLKEIMQDIDSKGLKITSINIHGSEEWNSSIHGYEAKEPKKRKNVSMISYPPSLHFSIIGDEEFWVEGIKSAIENIVKEETLEENMDEDYRNPMKTSESRSLDYKSAIVDSDFLTRLIKLLNTSGLTDIQIRMSTENKSYEGDDIKEILQDIDSKGLKITSINIYGSEEWDSSIHGYKAREPKERKNVSMVSYPPSLHFGISGDEEFWVEGIKSAIENIINQGTWKEKIGESKWLYVGLYAVSILGGFSLAMAALNKSRSWAIAGIVLVLLWFAYIIFTLLVAKRNILMLATSYKETRAETLFTLKEKKQEIIKVIVAIVAAITGGIIWALISSLFSHGGK